jgi:hypothetical protein
VLWISNSTKVSLSIDDIYRGGTREIKSDQGLHG